MYVPESFKVNDLVKVRRFMDENSFATLVTCAASRPFASHLPILVGGDEQMVLRGHIARANPQAEHIACGGEVLVIFPGPHAYISPFWYRTSEAVPTWNYATVHAYGSISVVREKVARQIVEQLTRRFERERADALFNRWSEPFISRMLDGIVAFEVRVTRLEGKFKLGQNRSAEDIAGVFEGLRGSADPAAAALANVMERERLV